MNLTLSNSRHVNQKMAFRITIFALCYLSILFALCTTARADLFTDDFNDGSINSRWNLLQNGTSVTETGGELQIQGTTQASGWQGNGLKSDHDFHGGDFDVSVDFSVPEFSGTGHKLVYLVARGANSDEVGLFYSYGFGYRVQTWTPRQFSTWLRPFGDEDSVYHTMRLVYDASADLLTGYVDEFLVGSIDTGATGVQMDGDVSFSIRATTEFGDVDVDLRFDNFRAVPEPTTFALTSACLLAATCVRRKRS